MTIEASIQAAETSLIKALESKRSAIDDRTGKGSATELIIERDLLQPHLPPHLRCGKGAVVQASAPAVQSPAIDRVISDPSAASPLLYDEAHSIFPIEAVCGLVEITMHLDASKLREDIERMVPVKAMRIRRYLKPIPGSKTKTERICLDAISPRSFIVGLPADPNWRAETIASALRSIQTELGAPTHVHGVYALGVGFFETVGVDSDAEAKYRIRAWLGPDRLFRFTTSLRQSFDRWQSLSAGWSADLQSYVNGNSSEMAK